MSSLSVRLLSSVAVVGRDNEPIYLRGDLCDTATILNLDKITDEFDADADESVSILDADASVNEENSDDAKQHTEQQQEDDSDPFGFFTQNSHSMSLTNQLVLHASLDRFEEMARSSGGGTVRWRMPGSSGTNAMWMGRLCEVEERWNVYGKRSLVVNYWKSHICCCVRLILCTCAFTHVVSLTYFSIYETSYSFKGTLQTPG